MVGLAMLLDFLSRRVYNKTMEKHKAHAHNFKDIPAGSKFGSWLVLKYAGTGWAVRCACGTESVVSGGDLRRGHSTGCKACHLAETPILTGRRLGDLQIGPMVKLTLSRQRVYQVSCKYGHVFQTTYRKGLVCPTCRTKQRAALATETRWAAVRAQQHARHQRTLAKTTTKTTTCIVCFTPFEFKHIEGSTENKYCSYRCYKKARRSVARNRSRAKQFNVPYEPINSYLIFRRDNWTCQMCGFAVDVRLRKAGYRKDEASAEIDHIVPMENGGANISDNVQTICFDCHKQKSGWERLDDTAVVCIETGKTYISLAEAAREAGVARGAIADSLRNTHDHTWRSTHWLLVAKAPKADDVKAWGALRKTIIDENEARERLGRL